MALDPAWIAVIGTAGGAIIGTVGGALVEYAKVATQGKQQRLADAERREHESKEARREREAAAAESNAQRHHEAARRLREERRVLVDSWRSALGVASTDYKNAKYAEEVNRGSTVQSRRNVQIPDVVGMTWFETLRPHLSDDFYKQADTLECDRETTVALSAEVARIEQEWFGEDKIPDPPAE